MWFVFSRPSSQTLCVNLDNWQVSSCTTLSGSEDNVAASSVSDLAAESEARVSELRGLTHPSVIHAKLRGLLLVSLCFQYLLKEKCVDAETHRFSTGDSSSFKGSVPIF